MSRLEEMENRRAELRSIYETSKANGEIGKMVYHAHMYANLQISLGMLADAMKLISDALSFLTEEEYPEEYAYMKQVLADLKSRSGQVDTAYTLLVQGETICRKHHFQRRLSDILLDLGKLDIQNRNLEFAKVRLEESLSMAEEVQERHVMADDYWHLGEIGLREGRYEEAISLLKRSLQLQKSVKHSLHELYVLRALCFASGQIKKAGDVELYANQAIDLMKQMPISSALRESVQNVIEGALKAL